MAVRDDGANARHMSVPPGLSWRRVHPITPALEGWKIIAGVLAIVSIQNIDEAIEVYRALQAADFDLSAISARTLWIGLAVALAVLVGGAALLVAGWRARSFAVDGDAVYMRSGILAKQLRIARLPRIQSVDIVHPLLGRVFGLGQLVVEVAGGSDSHVTIGYLRTEELEDLRQQILDLAAGAPTGPASAGAGPAGIVSAAGSAAMAGPAAGRAVGPAPVTTPAAAAGPCPATPRDAGALHPGAFQPAQVSAGSADGGAAGLTGAHATAPTGHQVSGAEPALSATGGDRAGRAQVPGKGGATSSGTGLPLGFEDLAAPASAAERERMAAARRRLGRPEETPLYEVDTRVLAGSILRSVGVWLAVAVVVGVGIVAALVLTGVLGGDEDDSLSGTFVALLPLALAAGEGVWSMVKGGWGFRAAATPAGIRVRHGLTSTVSTTLPPGRVHAVHLRQGPLWRGKDWWKVSVGVAGRSGGEDGGDSSAGSSNVLLPVGERDTALRALWLVVPDLGVTDPGRVLEAALTGLDDDGVGDALAPIGSPERGFVRVSPRARLFTPLGLRRSAVLATGTCLIFREGRIWRRVTVVPYARIQSFKAEQGPFARRRDLAAITLDMVPGAGISRQSNLEVADAAALRDLLAERCLASARAEHLDRWLARALEDAAARGGSGTSARG